MKIEGDPSLNELLEVSKEEGEYITAASQSVDTLVDARKLGQVPKGFLGMMPQIAGLPQRQRY